MMNQFNNLRMKYKLLVLPAFAILGLTIVMISASYFNSRADHELQLVRRGYYPSVQLSRDVEHAVVTLQRALQDGVAASDAAAIAETDEDPPAGAGADRRRENESRDLAERSAGPPLGHRQLLPAGQSDLSAHGQR